TRRAEKDVSGAGFRSVCLRRDRRSQASHSSPSLGECFGMVPIYVDNEFGEGISPFLSDALLDINARIPYRSVIPPFASNDRIVAKLYKLMMMKTRVFVVHLFPTLASQFFTKAKEVGMMSEGYAWIVIDAAANALGLLDPSAIDSMQRVLGVEPYIPTTKQLANFTNWWKTKFQRISQIVEKYQVRGLSVFGILSSTWSALFKSSLITSICFSS
ncbi:hypothetical protein U1Q18_011808, partial [Sarracenia purpurea var. burkii]